MNRNFSIVAGRTILALSFLLLVVSVRSAFGQG